VYTGGKEIQKTEYMRISQTLRAGELKLMRYE
jgi:hypothetical protein